MKSELRVIGLMFIVLLLTACSKDGESPEETQPVINLYVYSPDHPTITRGDVGNVASIDKESEIKTLQIWVFEHGTGTRVSYYQPETVYNLNNGDGVTYQLKVSDEFSMAFPKPTVDVYVVANAASCGLSLGESTTRDALEIAKIGSTYFGLSSLTTTVPDGPNGGLPMSGVLRDVAVTGSAPVFKISSVKLTRAVSKLRFIFSRDNVETPVTITGIQLGTRQIPKEEFLFLKADQSLTNIVEDSENREESYVAGDTPLFTGELAINKNEDPLKYTYQSGQNAQDYENLIATGLSEGKLSGVGPFYLRESDRKLSGVISYKIGDTPKEATFEMKAEGDFSRNHTWIVYAYYGVDGMQVISVYIQKWEELYTKTPHEVNNW